MKNYIKIGFLMLLPGFLLAQGGLLNQGAKIKISEEIQLKVLDGGISNQANGEVLNKGQIHLEKDWKQQGTYSNYLGDGWLMFIGQDDQEIISNQPMSIANMQVNNGHRLILNSDIQIHQQLDLSNNGLIELGINNLLIDPTARISNYDAQHYVLTNSTGFLQQEVAADFILFPIGNETYNPAVINNRGVTDDFRIRVENATHQTEAVVNRTWQIEEAIQGGSLASLRLQWDEAQELTHFDRNASAILQGNNAALPITYSSAAVAGSDWSQIQNNLTNFSSFTITSRAATILPQARLDDGQPLIGKVQLFPNPAENFLNIRLEEQTGTAFIQIFDVKGSLVLQTNKAIGNQHIVQLNNIGQLIDGVYSIQITTEDQTTTHKFVKGQL